MEFIEILNNNYMNFFLESLPQNSQLILFSAKDQKKNPWKFLTLSPVFLVFLWGFESLEILGLSIQHNFLKYNVRGCIIVYNREI